MPSLRDDQHVPDLIIRSIDPAWIQHHDENMMRTNSLAESVKTNRTIKLKTPKT